MHAAELPLHLCLLFCHQCFKPYVVYAIINSMIIDTFSGDARFYVLWCKIWCAHKIMNIRKLLTICIVFKPTPSIILMNDIIFRPLCSEWTDITQSFLWCLGCLLQWWGFYFPKWTGSQIRKYLWTVRSTNSKYKHHFSTIYTL